MRILFSALILVLGSNLSLKAQITGNLPASEIESISQNSISNMASIGDTIYIGPKLQRNINFEANPEWFVASGLDSLITGGGSVYSFSLSPDTVLAGVGRTIKIRGDNAPAGYGFYLSTSGGDDDSWQWIDFPLDDRDDSLYTYGSKTYNKLPVVVAGESPPYDVAHRGNTLFAAAWASGVMRSTDFGQTWKRIISPPAFVDTLTPERTYNYSFDPRNDNNLLGFSVHIDSDGWVWHGSAGGVNISPNALTAPPDSIIWYHRRVGQGQPGDQLLGNWVTFIDEDETGRIWMTNWIAAAGEQFGIVSTDNKGRTFNRYLAGEKIYQVSVDGEHVVATGDNGLFISKNGGQSWNQITSIQNDFGFIKPSATYYGNALINDRIWVSTSDGIATTTDLNTWEIIRVNLNSEQGNQFQDDPPNVETYAYPNPFSPSRHEYQRIRVEAQNNGNQNVTIRLYDFSMNLIRELDSRSIDTESAFEAIWDGKDGDGKLVHNGAVFYSVEIGGKRVNGKIMVLD
jgi:hypothetical protein